MTNRPGAFDTAPPSARGQGILGALLMVDDEVRHGRLGLGASRSDRLLEILRVMSSTWESTGLPPKLFYFRFTEAQLLVVLARRSVVAVLLRLDARLTEVEVAARKLVSTAHLKAPLDPATPLVACLLEGKPQPTHSPEPIPEAAIIPAAGFEPSSPAHPNEMTWSDATRALEIIVTKVLSQAIAAKVIAAALHRRELDPTAPCDATTLGGIAAEILQKIPNRAVRSSIERKYRVSWTPSPETSHTPSPHP